MPAFFSNTQDSPVRLYIFRPNNRPAGEARVRADLGLPPGAAGDAAAAAAFRPTRPRGGGGGGEDGEDDEEEEEGDGADEDGAGGIGDGQDGRHGARGGGLVVGATWKNLAVSFLELSAGAGGGCRPAHPGGPPGGGGRWAALGAFRSLREYARTRAFAGDAQRGAVAALFRRCAAVLQRRYGVAVVA